MLVSDYIVEFFIQNGITDVFGYPGGMVTQLMDSFRKYDDKIHAHVTYHEQAAAFAACGYAQTSGKPGVAYATSGPGATNLITGICNAYFDSIPCIFITGQVNTNESKKGYAVRQRGFQETDIVSMIKNVTKYSVYVDNPHEIRYQLEKSYNEAVSGRKGPVLLDIPMDIFRAEIEPDELIPYVSATNRFLSDSDIYDVLLNLIRKAKRPIILYGYGVKDVGCKDLACEVARKLHMPIVTSMLAIDIVGNDVLNMGFIGAYGNRAANFAVAKSDLVISMGARLDVRQVGAHRQAFAPGANIVRIDIDKGELSYPVHENEVQINTSVETALNVLLKISENSECPHIKWLEVCKKLQTELDGIDMRLPNQIIDEIGRNIPNDVIITTDVGQNQVWVAQSFPCKDNQQILFSGGHGAMGYSLPAAIGAYYGSGKKPVYCITGDGGLQMNVQELQFLTREQIPVKIIVLNNRALGMIRHFQEMYFDSKFFQTKLEGGYSSPDFVRVAEAYGIHGCKIGERLTGQAKDLLHDSYPALVEVEIFEDTYVFPKLEFGKPNQDQEPLLGREKYKELMEL